MYRLRLVLLLRCGLVDRVAASAKQWRRLSVEAVPARRKLTT